MKLPTLFNDTDDRAVSPVIGVILMVAITVILAAVIGTFVLDLGQELGDDETAPQLAVEATVHSDLNMSKDLDDETMGFATISHDTGDSLDANNIEIQIVDENNIEVASLDATGDPWEAELDDDGGDYLNMTADVGDEFSGGDTIVLELVADAGYATSVADSESDLEASEEYTIEIVHEPSGSVVSDSDILLPAEE